MGKVRIGRAPCGSFSEDEEAVEQVGVEFEVSAAAARPVVDAPLDDSGFADFAVAGTEFAGEYRCADCGYGAVVQHVIPHCPMCGGTVWERRGPLAPRLSD
jgi:rubrerythrin